MRPAVDSGIGSAIAGRLPGEPALSWSARIQPVPLHRARVVFAGPRVRSHLPDADHVYRRDLRTLWRLARIREPLEGDLGLAMRFRGSSTDPLNARARWNRPDLSNLVTAVEDAGNPDPRSGWEGLWGDDRQVLVIVAEIELWKKHLPDPLVALDVWRLS